MDEITTVTLTFNQEDREMMDKLRKHVNDDSSTNPFSEDITDDNVLLRLLIKKSIKLCEKGKTDSIF